MKYFYEGTTEVGHGPTGIMFGQIFSISKMESGRFIFRDECDGVFTEILPSDKAIEMLQEAIDWIKEERNK